MKVWATTLLILFAGCAVATGGKKTVNVNSDAEALRKENAKLKEERAKLQKECAKLKAEVKRLRAELDRMRGDPPARSIAGRVTAVEAGKVTISVGDTEGVRVGDIFHLRRGATFVGRMTIQDVAKAESIGEFDTEFAGLIGPPRVGDLAYVAHD
jgi:cell shape-determining protein MreC